MLEMKSLVVLIFFVGFVHAEEPIRMLDHCPGGKGCPEPSTHTIKKIDGEKINDFPLSDLQQENTEVVEKVERKKCK